MFGLMDCNNFFVSCERLFRPDLIGKPVAVLSSNDGCIVARSQEVKDLGIPMGAPLFQIQDMVKTHHVTLFSSNFALYRDVSSRVMHALKEEFADREVYSVDEAFFEVPTDSSEKSMAGVRARITQKTGIPVSIGVAPTMTLAKVAGSIAKRCGKTGRRPTSSCLEGVCVMGMGEWMEMTKDVSCGSIWGIGRQTSAFLTNKRVNTVAEFLALDPAYVRKELGVMGERLRLELSGTSVHKLGDRSEAEQESYTSTRSFPHPIHDKLTILSALGYHTARVAEKLRSDEQVALKVGVLARGSRFGEYAHRLGYAERVLVVPTDDTTVLTKEVIDMFEHMYDKAIPYKKVGVIVGGVEPKKYTSASLFEIGTHDNTVDILRDSLNQKFGKDTIRQGIALHEERWQEKHKLKSPSYTTSWREIARVKAI